MASQAPLCGIVLTRVVYAGFTQMPVLPVKKVRLIRHVVKSAQSQGPLRNAGKPPPRADPVERRPTLVMPLRWGFRP